MSRSEFRVTVTIVDRLEFVYRVGESWSQKSKHSLTSRLLYKGLLDSTSIIASVFSNRIRIEYYLKLFTVDNKNFSLIILITFYVCMYVC